MENAVAWDIDQSLDNEAAQKVAAFKPGELCPPGKNQKVKINVLMLAPKTNPKNMPPSNTDSNSCCQITLVAAVGVSDVVQRPFQNDNPDTYEKWGKNDNIKVIPVLNSGTLGQELKDWGEPEVFRGRLRAQNETGRAGSKMVHLMQSRLFKTW